MSEERPDELLALEIKQEVAAAYFRLSNKMLAAVEAFQAFDRGTNREHSTGEWEQRRSELLEDAGELVYFFLIQREAMKLPIYEELLQEYGIPEEVRRRIGPRPLKKNQTQ